MPEIADAAARRRALDPAGSFIVQAPAGSGKTELLVQRVLALIARADNPESVVAITFTKKAAGEMRERILLALREAAASPEPSEPYLAGRWRLARAVLARDSERGWRLLDHPGRLRIDTIDALCYSLTRQMPWVSRFGAPPDLIEDAAELYHRAARRALGHLDDGGPAADDVERLLVHLDNNFGVVEELLVTMLVRRDQWLRHIVQDVRREDLEAALENTVRAYLVELEKTAPPALVKELPWLKQHAAENLGDGGWPGIAELLLTKSGEYRARVDRRLGFPPGSPKKLRMEDLLETLRSLHPDYAPLLGGVRLLPPVRYSDEQWEVMRSLFNLLKLAEAELRMVFREQRAVDFCALAQAALQALGDAEHPTDLAYALDYRIQHLLVDEFQDTSYNQFLLLEKLTAAWAPEDGRTLFLVGDPMQSIYRFREADVTLFLKARDEGIGHLRLEPLQLEVNFRSEQGIVDWVNRAFETVLPARDDIATGAVRFYPSVSHHPAGSGPAVVVHAFAQHDPAAEADRVLEIIESARTAGPHGRIAVLVRARSHAGVIMQRLRQAGLGYLAVEIDELASRPILQDLRALAFAMLHAADRVSWLAVLRAPWCGMTLADLVALAGDDARAVLWDRLRDDEVLRRLTADGRARLTGLRDTLAPLVEDRRRMPLRRWVETAWRRLGGPACVRDATELADAEVFFDLLEAAGEGADLIDFESLDRQVERLYARPDVEADGSLQVLTMHKAKGLEFDTVILPGLGAGERPDDPRLLLWQERGPELLLALIKEAGRDSDPIYQYLHHIDREKDKQETGRLLYVAATRAKKRLHLLGHIAKGGTPQSGSLLSRLWPEVESEFAGLSEPGEPVPEVAARREVRLRRLAADYRPPPLPAPVAWKGEEPAAQEREEITFEWVGDTLRHVGTVVHRLLERIANEGAAAVGMDRPRILSELENLGVPAREREQSATKVEQAIAATLADPRGRWILAPHDGARSEFALTGEIGGRVVSVVVDRTFIEDGVRWIIDYKTSAHTGGDIEAFLDNERERYREQLERYARLMAEMDPRPIRLALYFPLLSAWREHQNPGE